MSKLKLFYAKAKDVHGAKLIDFDKGNLSVCEDGGKLLDKLPKNKNTNLLFIFGNARSGKSFMMNCLTGVRGMFKVVNSSIPCTRGVDISSHIVPHSSLAEHVNTFSENKIEGDKDMNLGFVDVEGQGAEDGTYDTMLALPLLVTSKVVLFNHKGAPTVTDMLSKLGVLARAADYIDLDDGEGKAGGGDADDSGSKPKKFGHLHVLFRDFSFDGDPATVYEQLLGKEKIVKKAKTVNSSANDPSKAAKERNDIRQLLIDNFQSITIHLFKQPANADELKDHKELPEELIDPEFVETVSQLLCKVTEQMKEPTLFNGKPLTGPKLKTLITTVCKQVNEGGAINVPSVFRAMEKETVMRIGGLCYNGFKKAAEAIRVRLPVPDKECKEQLKKAIEDMLVKFDDELTECLLDTEKKAMRTEIELTAKKMEDDVNRENRDATLLKVKQVISTRMTKLRKEFEQFCEDNIPLEDGRKLDRKFADLKKEAMTAIHDDLSTVEGATNTDEFRHLLLESEETLQEFLQFKSIQNENTIKDNSIKKLREDAIKTQQTLIEQNKKLEQFLDEEKEHTIRVNTLITTTIRLLYSDTTTNTTTSLLQKPPFYCPFDCTNLPCTHSILTDGRTTRKAEIRKRDRGEEERRNRRKVETAGGGTRGAAKEENWVCNPLNLGLRAFYVTILQRVMFIHSVCAKNCKFQRSSKVLRTKYCLRKLGCLKFCALCPVSETMTNLILYTVALQCSGVFCLPWEGDHLQKPAKTLYNSDSLPNFVSIHALFGILKILAEFFAVQMYSYLYRSTVIDAIKLTFRKIKILIFFLLHTVSDMQSWL